MYVVILLYVFALINPHTCFTCPSNFQNTDEGICYVLQRRTPRFCSAAAYCARIGKREKQLVYLIGRNILRLPRLSEDSHGMHTGLNFLLDPPNGGALVWRDLDPNNAEYTATEKEVSYKGRSIESTRRFRYLWFPVERSMRDVPFYSLRNISPTICEYGGNLPYGDRKVRFLSNFPKPVSDLVHSIPSLSGCEIRARARTKLDCARKCALNPTCRSVYYDSATNSCIHMMYADSLLSLSTAHRGSDWIRFAKTSLAINMTGEN